MPDVIKLLPDAIANQIAAGEVIQRPASAVKELLENAVDAGSTEVKLIIRDAGKNLIQVVDNGCGMSVTDARMSFERHATSKIRAAEDLWNIRTMGFRGEALASIAAVAQVELKSRKHEMEIGNRIVIEGSELKLQEPCQCPSGTSLAIKNLFFNTPARRNFLKSNTVETRHIIDEFQRVSLANPNIHFVLDNNGLEVFHLPVGNLRKRIINIFGSNYNERLVPVDEETDIVKIWGFIGKPENAKKTRGEQFFFVNNRFIKSPYLHHAILNAYDDLIPQKTHPLYTIFLEMDPEKVDVNVHPTKQEIKFEDEKLIYAILRSSVKRALGKYSVTPTLDFDQETSFSNINFNREKVEVEQGKPKAPKDRLVSFNPDDMPGKGQQKQDWRALYETGQVEPQTITVPSNWAKQHLDENELGIDEMEHEGVTPYQMHNRYIVTPIKSGIIIIDQQSAHERVLFERYLSALELKNMSSQRQLFPQTVHLGTADANLLKDILAEINALGFEIQEFGKDTFVVHGVPADVNGGNEEEVIEGLLEQFKENQQELKLQKRENLARSMALQTCIKAGKPLTAQEMKKLIDELFACNDFYLAPNGRLTFVRHSLEELDKLFMKRK